MQTMRKINSVSNAMQAFLNKFSVLLSELTSMPKVSLLMEGNNLQRLVLSNFHTRLIASRQAVLIGSTSCLL